VIDSIAAASEFEKTMFLMERMVNAVAGTHNVKLQKTRKYRSTLKTGREVDCQIAMALQAARISLTRKTNPESAVPVSTMVMYCALINHLASVNAVNRDENGS
jgi:hypothetical protein